jgi:DivIVA domain-containing protein
MKEPPGERLGSDARPVTGDEVRNITFLNAGGFGAAGVRGYDASDVDDLLGRVAAELDAGRPAGPLIENATFQTWGKRLYDIDAVDWFLGQFLLHGRSPEMAGTSGDPWRDLGVVAQFPRGGGRYGFDEKCTSEWQEFGQQPGTHLRLRWARVASSRRELCTAEQQPLALKEFGQSGTVSIGERSFTFNTPGHAGSSSPDIAEIAARSWRDYAGHFAAQPASGRAQAEASGREPGIAQPLAEVSFSPENSRRCVI